MHRQLFNLETLGCLDDLIEVEPGPLAALLSCLVTESGGSPGGDNGGKGGKEPDAASLIKSKHMVEPFEKLREHARRIATTIEECHLTIDTKAYVDGFSTALIDVVCAWCDGAKFVEVMQLLDGTTWMEGSIIRTFHRLEELLRQLIDAAKVVGNEELESRCSRARTLLVRDVVFAASLYT